MKKQLLGLIVLLTLSLGVVLLTCDFPVYKIPFIETPLGVKPLAIGDKVRYTGDIPSAYNKLGWIICIEDKMSDKIHDNYAPYMVAFKNRIKPDEITDRWHRYYEDNKHLFANYGGSHPYPFSLAEELRYDFTNKLWASENELELINTSHKKNLKEGVKTIISVSLETLDSNELEDMEDALLPPEKWYQENNKPIANIQLEL